jgi:CheY-like chemotaxis protein
MVTSEPRTIDSYLFQPSSGKFPRPSRKGFLTDSLDGKSKHKVLVVDDEELIAESLAEILRSEGFDAIVALSGEDAVALANEVCPDIVITDVLMPDIDGVETAIRIRVICPKARIILFSGQAATSDILKKAKADGHEFQLLPKPLHPARLLEAVHKLM